MRRLLGWPAKGHWTLPRHFKAIFKDYVKKPGVGHRLAHELTPKPTPEAEAAVEVALGVEAGVTAGLIARAILRVALRVDDPGPLMNLCLGRG